MLARVDSPKIGLEGTAGIEVERCSGQILPGMTIVGLPDAAVQESRMRVQAAIKNAGLPYPRARIVVNLAHQYFPHPPFTWLISISMDTACALARVKPLPPTRFVTIEMASN